ncbi:uncharacterized protein [Rutidosis leptorrhynchoides]|uniref:uncharacterized protein n=1 Tax=Rutidosis leptorrhynchoides TaxID=125765 RepID=UPI003A99812D
MERYLGEMGAHLSFNIRDIIHAHVVHKIGNGTTTNVWFDRWHPNGTIAEIVSRRNILSEGYSFNEKVCDIVHGFNFTWPNAWYSEFNAIQDVAPLILTDQSDVVQWRDCGGNWIDFLVSLPDSHDHLFFDCPVSKQLCEKFTHVVSVANWSSGWKNIRDCLTPFANCSVARGVVAKLIFGALVYYVWQEKNNRLYGQKARSVDQLYEVIFSTVRMKLLSINFWDSSFVRVMKECWKVP